MRRASAVAAWVFVAALLVFTYGNSRSAAHDLHRARGDLHTLTVVMAHQSSQIDALQGQVKGLGATPVVSDVQQAEAVAPAATAIPARPKATTTTARRAPASAHPTTTTGRPPATSAPPTTAAPPPPTSPPTTAPPACRVPLAGIGCVVP